VANQVAHSSQTAPPLLVRTVRSTHRLDSGQEYRIGRDDRADIPLPDARVSWEHAVLRAEGPVWVLEDRNSRNGTFLGSDRVGRLEITGPFVVHFGHPEDGPVLRFELQQVEAPGPEYGDEFPGPRADDTTFMPGVDRQPTSRLRLQSKVMSIGRRPDNDIVVADLGVSKQHAELRLSPTGRYSIIDLNSHNGTFVNGSRVNQQELDENDLIAIGHATFRLAGGELIEYVDDGRATFEAHELQVVVQDGGKRKVLLDGITFPLEERSMMAVIGPAGAGKSTLLNALTGKRPANTGTVYYDFRDLYDNYDELKHRIGLVPQESVTHDQLTAKTALGYAADLRFPADVAEAERDQRVGEVLEELSMSQHANTRIDRLSGGQKKRVNIGLELLTRPSLLFLDEPTSPLDPHLKRDMFLQMRKMADKNADKGQSVVVITHDVESKLIDQCDRLIVLQPGGKMAYFGPPDKGLRYFGRDDWADVFQGFADEPQRDWSGEFRSSPEFSTYVATPISVRALRQQTPRPESETPKPRQRGRLNQIITMASRYRKVMAADRGFLIVAALLPILLGGLVRLMPLPHGVGLTNLPGKHHTNGNALQVLMILVMAACLTGIANSINEFIKERGIFERERMAGLSAGAYLLSKVLVLSVLCVVQVVAIVIIGLAGVKLPGSGVVIPGPALIEVAVALSILCVVAMLLGLVVSTLVTKNDQTMPALVGLVMLQVALSGGMFPLTGGVSIVSLIAPARWGLAAIGSTLNLNDINPLNPDAGASQGQDAMWNHTPHQWLLNIAFLLVIGVICIVVAQIRLSSIGPKKRKSSS
jgi:ABC transport system ATP-binding/permease protein